MEIKRIGCIIMASGLSKRFGSNKLLAVVNGQSLIEHALTLVQNVSICEIFPLVLTRTQDVVDLCKAKGVDVRLHALPNRNEAVKLGVESLLDKHELDGILFCPCDQPLLKKRSLEKLFEAFLKRDLEENVSIFRLSYGDAVGTPILFSRKHFEELRKLPDKKGGSYIAKEHDEAVEKVYAESEWELFDIDTPADLEKVLKKDGERR